MPSRSAAGSTARSSARASPGAGDAPLARESSASDRPAGVLGAHGDGLLPWLAAPLATLLGNPRASHALLIHGPSGVGQFELAVAAAQAMLCESASADGGACGECASCRLVQAQTHPDLLVLLPEALREPLGWVATAAEGDGEGATAGGGSGSARRKPSRELRVDDLRSAVAFAQTTSTRGGAKLVVIHPAERMNAIAANALLKTLEEPPAAVRLILCTGDVARLLPTIRSRCQALELPLPDPEVAGRWLAEQGAGDTAAVLLRAAGGQPQEALGLLADGIDANAWIALPARLAAGDSAALQGWPLPRLLQALLCVCVDLQRMAQGAPPRRFPAAALPMRPTPASLNAWGRRLLDSMRSAEHPYHLPLAVDALVAQAQTVLSPPAASGMPRRRS